MPSKKPKILFYIALLGLNLLYACVGVGTKYAAGKDFLSQGYVIGLGGAVVIMGIYAMLWQQVLKRVELSMAYMFKGTALIFTMLLAYLLFGEPITLNNMIGASIIIFGITLYNIQR